MNIGPSPTGANRYKRNISTLHPLGAAAAAAPLFDGGFDSSRTLPPSIDGSPYLLTYFEPNRVLLRQPNDSGLGRRPHPHEQRWNWPRRRGQLLVRRPVSSKLGSLQYSDQQLSRPPVQPRGRWGGGLSKLRTVFCAHEIVFRVLRGDFL